MTSREFLEEELREMLVEVKARMKMFIVKCRKAKMCKYDS
jgi:hypothetical protein